MNLVLAVDVKGATLQSSPGGQEVRQFPEERGGRPSHNHPSFNYRVCGRLMVVERQASVDTLFTHPVACS